MSNTFKASRDIIIRTEKWSEALEFYGSVLGLPITERSQTIVVFETGVFLLRGCSYLKGEAKDLDTSSAELGRSPARRKAKQSRERSLAHCGNEVFDSHQIAGAL